MVKTRLNGGHSPVERCHFASTPAGVCHGEMWAVFPEVLISQQKREMLIFTGLFPFLNINNESKTNKGQTERNSSVGQQGWVCGWPIWELTQVLLSGAPGLLFVYMTFQA